jgi:gamma-glutamylcyclotransferase (GGCT)/AIG2-like uncharacterized protein YtfP
MPSQEPIHLFVYGTLTNPERVTALTGKPFARVDAVLRDFERVNSPLGYPFILPRPGAMVQGVLLRDVDLASLAQLDVYEAEGKLYRRQSVVVEVADRRVPAMAYVGHGIRASIAPLTTSATNPSCQAARSEARIPAQRLRAPCAEEP